MKIIVYFLVVFFCMSPCLMAQKKDSLKLSCPLNEAIEPPAEKPPYSLGVAELKLVLTSNSDTTVKACTNGTITNVMRDDDGTWMIMFNHNDYYFLYTGMSKTSVRKGQRLQNGDAVGIIKPGQKIDFQLYDFETALDPKKYLNCFKSQ